MMMSQSLQPSRSFRAASPLLGGMLAACLGILASGCASVSNPVLDGVEARRVEQEYLAPPKEDLQTIPLTTLGQPKPEFHILGIDDILGVYIEGILGEKGQPLPFRFPELGNLTPSVGFPIPISSDGTLPLPLIDPLKIVGMTVKEAENAIRKAYTVDNKIILPGRERILLSLIRARQFRVQVVRQDTPQSSFGSVQNNSRRGTGATINLPIYENDVLNALNQTGGLPGLDARNEIIIQRNVKGADDTRVVRIPLRVRQGSGLPFRTSDVVLENGDVVFIEARDTEVFYVAGLAIPRQFPLPRDYDLTVTQALAQAGGPLVNGGVNQNNLSGAVIQSGLGSPSPSSVTVIRKLKSSGQVKIIVNINRALNDPRENIIVMSGDTLVLQESPGEALTRYFSSTVRFNFLATIIREMDLFGTINYNGF